MLFFEHKHHMHKQSNAQFNVKGDICFYRNRFLTTTTNGW